MKKNKKKYFFIGIAGSGMSAIAQYLKMQGHFVEGSDRLFSSAPEHFIRKKLEESGIKTFEQGKATIKKKTDIVVVSTAIEDTVPEYKQAVELKIPILHRSLMLKKIIEDKKTIAVAGTSGKSTTTAMIFTILEKSNLKPSIINGSGLTYLEQKGLLGNAYSNSGEWLVVEADESDGTLIHYNPEIGIILNIDRDHKEFFELEKIFSRFAENSKNLIVNLSNKRSTKLSKKSEFDFGSEKSMFYAENIKQTNKGISFKINDTDFFIPVIGLHNVENATAAISVASMLEIPINEIAAALKQYKGIDRRMQIIGTHKGITVIDDYAHNPVKIASAIKSAQNLGRRVFAFFQPHGFGPLNFFKNELLEALEEIYRDEDSIYLSKVFYAGGIISQKISVVQIVNQLKKKGIKAYFLSDKTYFADMIIPKLENKDIVLIMGARDPSLGEFSKKIFEKIKASV